MRRLYENARGNSNTSCADVLIWPCCVTHRDVTVFIAIFKKKQITTREEVKSVFIEVSLFVTAVSASRFLSVRHLSSFLMAWPKAKCFLTSVLKLAGASSVSDFIVWFSPRHLQRPALSLYCQFCRVQRMMDMPGHCNCSSCFPPLCFTVAQKSTRFASKTCHLKPSYVHNSMETLLSCNILRQL